ncbi:hypothetical protein [Aurantiacibacter luteus]|uniref:Uncharacterized protein n=1 Tax=Aurantiacibacter luteus TaxID=1581420 RepID=A0A0G9MVC0_9SPHN|nr:hypothetical protein [Aurantiacibacter luteus]KLE34549.1 hypothetical protein AAW00_10090 [Aurantiacibacter luteus]
MTEDTALLPPDSDDAERQRMLSADIREEWRDMGPIAVAAMIPVALIMTVLSPLIADLAGWVFPIPFLLAFFGLPYWLAYRRRVESDLPFVIPGLGSFQGSRKKRMLLGGAIVATLATTAMLLLNMHAGHLMRALADTLGRWLG